MCTGKGRSSFCVHCLGFFSDTVVRFDSASKKLQYTDGGYFVHRIRTDFERNRDLTDPAEIQREIKINELNQREAALGISEAKSWHNQYKDSAWIYAGGLPYELSEGDVITVFSQYGEPVNINMIRDKKSGKSKGFCFLCYEDQRSTILAVDNLNGTKICGRTIRVDHVMNYKAPKEGSDDEIARILSDKGCGPEAVKDLEKVVIERKRHAERTERDWREDKEPGRMSPPREPPRRRQRE